METGNYISLFLTSEYFTKEIVLQDPGILKWITRSPSLPVGNFLEDVRNYKVLPREVFTCPKWLANPDDETKLFIELMKSNKPELNISDKKIMGYPRDNDFIKMERLRKFEKYD